MHSIHFRRLATTMLIALLAGWGQLAPAAEPISPADVKGPMTWGTAQKVTQSGDLFFADQPDRAGLEQARDAGVRVVINMRAPSELDWDEAAAAAELGLDYFNVPISGASFDPASIARIDALVDAHQGQKILLHCSSSNRAGGWLATHLIAGGMSSDEAIDVGRRAGITKQVIVDSVETWASKTGH